MTSGQRDLCALAIIATGLLELTASSTWAQVAWLVAVGLSTRRMYGSA